MTEDTPNLKDRIPDHQLPKKANGIVIILSVVVVILLVSTFSLTFLYASQKPVTTTVTQISIVTDGTFSTTTADPTQFYLTYVSNPLTYYVGKPNQTAEWNASVSLFPATLRYANSSIEFDYSLTVPQVAGYSALFQRFMGSFSNLTQQVIPISKILSTVAGIESSTNFTSGSLPILLTIVADSRTVFSMPIGAYNFATNSQGDAVTLDTFAYRSEPIN